MIVGYSTVLETAERWGITVRTVQTMCSKGRIGGAVKFGRAWAIPMNAQRPNDGRIITGKYKDWRKTKED